PSVLPVRRVRQAEDNAAVRAALGRAANQLRSSHTQDRQRHLGLGLPEPHQDRHHHRQPAQRGHRQRPPQAAPLRLH
ncbi:unnamed protein product, partial [Prorocentrum cordatum]